MENILLNLCVAPTQVRRSGKMARTHEQGRKAASPQYPQGSAGQDGCCDGAWVEYNFVPSKRHKRHHVQRHSRAGLRHIPACSCMHRHAPSRTRWRVELVDSSSMQSRCAARMRTHHRAQLMLPSSSRARTRTYDACFEANRCAFIHVFL